MISKTSNPNPKTHQYLPDGTGRDYYVKIDDGGLNREKQARSYTGGKFVMKNNQAHNTRPNIEAKGLYYRSDGTGRDNYIIVNEGGLTHFDKATYDYKYVQDLRTYPKYQMDDSNAFRPDFFQSSQSFRNKKQLQKDTINARIQQECTKRLSTPKTTLNPHQYPNAFARRVQKQTLY